jgi:16S rRNA (uracil1498-N3)-methyltransferase
VGAPLSDGLNLPHGTFARICQNQDVNLVLLEAPDVDAAGDVTLSGARAAHLLNVLKAAQGRSVRIGLVDGPYGTGTVTSRSDRAITMRCVFETEPPPRPPVDLLLALPRPKVMRRLWAQLAALGVGRVMLTNAERVERHYFDTHVLAVAEYRPLLIEGLQQARDTRLPVVSIHRQFKILIEDHLDGLFAEGVRVVADPSASTSLDAALREHPGPRLLLAIGPEGGWNDFERALLRAHGFDAVGMGSRTLRSDTACVALLTLAHRAMCRASDF